MCGIAGYVGDRESADVLVDALSKLEYRGYDSAGIAVFDHGNIKVKKCKGRLANLVEKMDEEGCLLYTSKWALILAFVMIVSVVVPAVLFSATDNVNAATGKSYDKTSLSYTGTYTDISLKKDADFKNAKYVSSSDEIISALQSAKAGDVIIIKCGTYKFSTSVIVNNTINGQDGSYIIVKAEDNHDVKFDFSAQVFNSQNRGFILDGDYWYFGGINFYGAGDNGVLLAGNNNIFERCVFEANRDTGLQLSR